MGCSQLVRQEAGFEYFLLNVFVHVCLMPGLHGKKGSVTKVLTIKLFKRSHSFVFKFLLVAIQIFLTKRKFPGIIQRGEIQY